MLEMSDTKESPWHIVRSDDKRRARLNLISHLLDLIPHKKVAREKIVLPKRSHKHEYDDQATMQWAALCRGSLRGFVIGLVEPASEISPRPGHRHGEFHRPGRGDAAGRDLPRGICRAVRRATLCAARRRVRR